MTTTAVVTATVVGLGSVRLLSLLLVALLLQSGSPRVGAFLLPCPSTAPTTTSSSMAPLLHHPPTHLGARKKPTADEAGGNGGSSSSRNTGGTKRQRSIEEVGSATLRLGRVDFPPTPDTQVGGGGRGVVNNGSKPPPF